MPPGLWAVLVLALDSIPGRNLPAVTGVDKAAHLALYGVLGMLSTHAVMRTPRWPGARALVAVIVGVSLFGAVDEMHQALIPGRTPDLRDWLADTAGAAAASVVTAAALARREPA